MAGHSHWARIKRQKAANDAKRGRAWSKLARRIIVAARSGGDPEDNLTLRYAIDDAKAANMPKDTIDRAIKKGTGELGGAEYEQVIYEGYGPGGVAFLVDCLTDNRNRTGAEVRKIFERAGGQLGATNCVAWMFAQKGTFLVSSEVTDEDTLMEIALEAGADDIQRDGDFFEITCDVSAYGSVKDVLAEREIPVDSSELAMVPNNTVEAAGDKARHIVTLMEAFEDHDDVQNVYTNADIADDVLAEAGG
ncbi:MAG: YebC/PmpR family DNA-binding transcriptional regulator [Phycisphaerae bacterium]|nr:YebC/PmpR family DNA-binding transcriptional regulator [Phycisphaerae bacterium]